MALDPAMLRSLLKIFLTDLVQQGDFLTDALLVLEQAEPADANHADDGARREAYAAVMRSAHNLKGGARSLGLVEVEAVFHAMESVFETLGSGALPPTRGFVDQCRNALHEVRSDIEAQAQGLPSAGRLAAISTALTAAPPPPAPAPNLSQPPSVAASSTVAVPTLPPPAPAEPEASPAVGSAAMETIQVKLGRLDRISALADDLVVSRSGIAENNRATRELRTRVSLDGRRWRMEFEHWRSRLGERKPHELETMVQGWLDALDHTDAERKNIQQQVQQSMAVLDGVCDALSLEVRKLRLVPVRKLLRRAMLSARDLATQLGKDVKFTIEGEAAEMDRLLVERLRDPLNHLLRNAIDHGIESAAQRDAAGKPPTGSIRISAVRDGSMLLITVSDDGIGIDAEQVAAAAILKGVTTAEAVALQDERQKIRLILEPGFSTRETVSRVSGRGVGLDVVNAAVLALKGSVEIDTCLRASPGRAQGTQFVLRLPGLLTRERGLWVTAAGREFVMPMNSLEHTVYFRRQDLREVDGETCIHIASRAIPLRQLAMALGLRRAVLQDAHAWYALILAYGAHRVAIVVDTIGREDDIVIKPLPPPLLSVANVRGTTFDEKGGVVVVLDDLALARSALRVSSAALTRAAFAEGVVTRIRRILVVDDTLTTRTLEMNILQAAGYQTEGRANGREALAYLRDGGDIDLVVTDLQMPEMDGAELTQHIRQSAKLEHLPIIVVTSRDEDEHRRRCMDAGASAYIVKGSFESRVLLETVGRLL